MPLSAPTRRGRPVLFGVVLAAVAAFAVLLPAAPAAAHTGVQSSSPSADATVTVAPSEVTLTFGHEVGSDPTNNVSLVQVVREDDNLFYSNGCADVNNESVTTGIALGESGRYLVAAKIVTEDGHVSTAEYGFTYERPAETAARTGVAQPPACANTATVSAAPESLFAPYVAPIPAFVLVGIALGFFVVLAIVVLFLVRRTTPRTASVGGEPPAAE
ncbi:MULTISPECIES: copper resistance CopC family protein [unclassified Rathayibacter]|uniref:copper resistance CopC family protein n=1 Tax=unclassified Rathayibacter TaxID=2609250 RepID=UPI0009E813B6|nr:MULTISPECIES: copper resistance CopC family protein [unclassified Rathayibacter]TDX74900.1 hypothetical protein EDF35_3875 [Rathayibacter sp. PhB151]